MESGDTASTGVRENTPPAPAGSEESKVPTDVTQPTNGETQSADRTDAAKHSPKEKCSKKRFAQKTRHKKPKTTASPVRSSSDLENIDSEDKTSSTSNSRENSVSETETVESKRVAKKRDDSHKSKSANAKKQKRFYKTRESVGSDSNSESSSSDSDQSSEDRKDQRSQENIIMQLQQLKSVIQQQQQQQQQGNSYQYSAGVQHYGATLADIAQQPVNENGLRNSSSRSHQNGQPSSGLLNPALSVVDTLLMQATQQLMERKKQQKPTKLDYKRVDQVWDNSIHNYKLQDTAEQVVENHHDEFIFHVRRTFDWEGKYKATYVDIKSKLLRECLQAVMENIKGVSLVEEIPKLDSNMLFL
mgnify:CR=1 FL=1|jgi:hypothetical protein